MKETVTTSLKTAAIRKPQRIHVRGGRRWGRWRHGKKIAIMNKHLNIVRYRMVRCYLKHAVEDLDKLFIVAKQSVAPIPVQFNLPEAREKYQW